MSCVHLPQAGSRRDVDRDTLSNHETILIFFFYVLFLFWGIFYFIFELRL